MAQKSGSCLLIALRDGDRQLSILRRGVSMRTIEYNVSYEMLTQGQ